LYTKVFFLLKDVCYNSIVDTTLVLCLERPRAAGDHGPAEQKANWLKCAACRELYRIQQEELLAARQGVFLLVNRNTKSNLTRTFISNKIKTMTLRIKLQK